MMTRANRSSCRETSNEESMNQDIELMRGLLLWLADAETWEVSYCEKQVSLKPDGSVDKVGMYNKCRGLLWKRETTR